MLSMANTPRGVCRLESERERELNVRIVIHYFMLRKLSFIFFDVICLFISLTVQWTSRTIYILTSVRSIMSVRLNSVRLFVHKFTTFQPTTAARHF